MTALNNLSDLSVKSHDMWQLVLLAFAGYLLLKFIQLYRADGDLTVLDSKIKPEYFQGRIVWVTGASSGSEL